MHYLSISGYDPDILCNSQGRFFSNEQIMGEKKNLFLILNETMMMILAK